MNIQFGLVCLSAACGLAAAPSCAQVAQRSQIPLSISINTPSPEIRTGSELKLDLVLTNTSNHPISLSMYPADFRLDVRDREGKVVYRARGTNKSAASAKNGTAPPPLIVDEGSHQARELRPHEVVRWKEVVSRRFDLNKPGKYTIQAIRTYENTAIRSNIVTITVAP
jgi:hypothetical protein